MKSIVFIALLCAMSFMTDAQDLNFKSDTVSNFQFATLFGTGKGYNGTLEDAMPASLGSKESESNLCKFSVRAEYFVRTKWAAGIQFTNSGHTGRAQQTVYSEYVPGSWFIFYFPGYTIYYDNIIDVTAVNNEFTFYGAYKLVDFKKKICPVEIIARAGMSAVMIKEEISMMVNDKQNGQYITKSEFIENTGTGVNLVLNTSMNLHLGRRFSLLVADLTQRVPVYNPEFDEATVYNGKQSLKIGTHKIPTAGFTYAAGLAFHF